MGTPLGIVKKRRVRPPAGAPARDPQTPEVQFRHTLREKIGPPNSAEGTMGRAPPEKSLRGQIWGFLTAAATHCYDYGYTHTHVGVAARRPRRRAAAMRASRWARGTSAWMVTPRSRTSSRRSTPPEGRRTIDARLTQVWHQSASGHAQASRAGSSRGATIPSLRDAGGVHEGEEVGERGRRPGG